MFIIHSPMTHTEHYLVAPQKEHARFSNDWLYEHPRGRLVQHLWERQSWSDIGLPEISFTIFPRFILTQFLSPPVLYRHQQHATFGSSKIMKKADYYLIFTINMFFLHSEYFLGKATCSTHLENRRGRLLMRFSLHAPCLGVNKLK